MSYSDPPPPPEPPQYGNQPPPSYGAPQPTNKKAVWSLVLGILGVLCCGFAGIPALILGQQAKKEIDAGQGTGRGMATAGFVLGIIGCALLVLGIILVSTGNFDINFNANS